MFYKTVWKTLNHIQTRLLIWGNVFESNGTDVIMCIPGNPGFTDFYIEFASELHESTGLPVCVIGHAGHNEDIPQELSKTDDLYNLKGQVAHKLDLINNHIDKKSKIHLIGHSIGAWLIIDLIEKDPSLADRVSSASLLFPTIQKMAESPNGKRVIKYVKNYDSFLVFLVSLISYLPMFIKTFIVNSYIQWHSLPAHYTDRIMKCINPSAIEKVILMALDEMATVTTLNSSVLDRIKQSTCVIYSSRDEWAPVEYFEDLKRFEPPMVLKLVDINHAFILKSSKRVAEMVAEFIKTKI